VGRVRVGFRLQVRPELLGEYRNLHSPVRREMLDVIAESGRRNYSLFLDESDGTLFGYYEVDNDAAAQASLAASEVATQWEAEMARFFIPPHSDGILGRADQVARRLTEVFNLADQRDSTES
jgi:L-rhamnose mutarotase